MMRFVLFLLAILYTSASYGQIICCGQIPLPIPVSLGGTALTALGSANQCLTTNSGATAMAWAACGSGTTYTAAASGGLNLAGTAFSLGDGVGITYTSPGQLTLTPTISTAQKQALQINGTYSSASVLTNRAVQDNSSYSGASGSSFASYDTDSTLSGTVTYNYFFGYEDRRTYSGSATLSTWASFTPYALQFTGSGTVTAYRGFQMTDVASTGGGTITEQDGIYVPDLTAGTTNIAVRMQVASGTNKYNIYQSGSAPSYFNGQVQFAAGQQWAGEVFVPSASQQINFATNADLIINGSSLIVTLCSCGDNANTYEPLFFKGSVITFNPGGTEGARFTGTGGGLSIGSTAAAGVGSLLVTATIKTGGYTVSGLPTGSVGMRAYVTDQTTACPVIGGSLTGSGAVTCPVFYNGSAWVSG